MSLVILHPTSSQERSLMVHRLRLSGYKSTEPDIGGTTRVPLDTEPWTFKRASKFVRLEPVLEPGHSGRAS